MKKLLKSVSLILSMVMLTGTLCVTAAPTIKATDENALAILEQLNIMLVNDVSKDFSADKVVTKGEFGIYLIRALGLIPNQSISLPFSDIVTGNDIAPYMQALYDAGIIHGYNNILSMDNPLSYNEAIKMAVAAIGYGDMAEMYGGYPDGYFRMASELKITDGLKISDVQSLTKKEVALLIFNMLSAELMEIKEFDVNGIRFEKSGKTMFSKLYNIYTHKGRVLKNSKASLSSSGESTQSGYVEIDGVEYLVGDTNAEDYLGYEIAFYYQYDEDADKSTLIYILESENQDKELYIKSEDLISFDNNRYTYADETGREHKVRLSDDFLILYNLSYPKSGFLPEMMMPKNGAVRILYGAEKGEADVIMIEDYVSYAVNSVDVSKEIIYGKNMITTDLSKIKYRVLNAAGKKTDLSVLQEWSVISEAWSADRSEVVLYISNTSLAGVVDYVQYEDGIQYVTVAGERAPVLENCYDKQKLTSSTAVVVYLDVHGRIAAVSAEKDAGMRYAYLMKAYVDENDEHGYVRLFDEGGTAFLLQVAEKPKINDVKYTGKIQVAIDNLDSLPVKLLRYKTNSKNQVNSFYVVDESKDYIHRVGMIQNIWNSNNRTFGAQATMEQDAPVFIIPPDGDVRDYKVQRINSFSHDTAYSVEVYTTGDNVYAEAILRNTSADSYVINSAVVKEVKQTLNEDDEVVRTVTLLYRGAEAAYEIPAEQETEIGVGDVLHVGFNSQNRLSNILKVYDASEDKLLVSNPYEPQSGAGYRSTRRIYMGYVYVKDNGLMKFGAELPTDDNFKTAYTENALLSAFNIYVVDMKAGKKERVCIGSANDIVDYLHSGANCSRVLVATCWNDPKEIIIIK